MLTLLKDVSASSGYASSLLIFNYNLMWHGIRLSAFPSAGQTNNSQACEWTHLTHSHSHSHSRLSVQNVIVNLFHSFPFRLEVRKQLRFHYQLCVMHFDCCHNFTGAAFIVTSPCFNRFHCLPRNPESWILNPDYRFSSLYILLPLWTQFT